MLPIIPIAAGLGGLAWWRASRRKGMTPERQKVYDTALATLKDPAGLRTLADSFAKEGLSAQAEMLRKRAALRELPEQTKVDRREALRKGLASNDQTAVSKLAAAFAREGASGAAEQLLKHVNGLKAAK